MQILLDTSGAARPTGSPPQRSLFKIPAGVFKGRLASLYMSDASTIKLTRSDYPYKNWSTPLTVISDSNDSPFSARMDGSGNIDIVYTDSSKDLKYLRLSFVSGSWSAGSGSYIITVDDNYNPSFLVDLNGDFWCFFINHNTSGDSKYYVRAKSSADYGATWGSGPTDPGTALSPGSVDISFVGGCRLSSKIYSIYADGRSDLKSREYDLETQSWDSEIGIHSGNYIDDDFDVAPSQDGRFGVVFAISGEQKVYYKEYDGSFWSGAMEVESCDARSPQIGFFDNIAHIFYAKNLGNDYYTVRAAKKTGENFSLSVYSQSGGIFDKVFVYDNSATGKYQDKTEAAASDTAGDVYHSESSSLVDAVDDCVYIGKLSKFNCIAVILSTAGTGGVVVWEYFNGAEWDPFTPYSGSFQFDSGDMLVYLWQDGESAPSNWQITKVNNYSAYWIRARVTTAFSTKPVGSQLVAASRCDDLALLREGK